MEGSDKKQGSTFWERLGVSYIEVEFRPWVVKARCSCLRLFIGRGGVGKPVENEFRTER